MTAWQTFALVAWKFARTFGVGAIIAGPPIALLVSRHFLEDDDA